MAVANRELEVPSQRRTVVLDKSNVKLRPGQYLIKTPEVFDITKGRRGEEIRTRRSYNGTAYGVKFENNIAVIDDESVREIREVMLDELEGDETRLPPWFRDPNGSAADLARKMQSDFGYEVTPELPKLKRLTKAQIAASAPYDPDDDRLLARGASDEPGEDSTARMSPHGRAHVPGVDDTGDEDGRAGMPAEPPAGEETRPARPAPVRERLRAQQTRTPRRSRGKKKEKVSG
jgi:hypothetical protein